MTSRGKGLFQNVHLQGRSGSDGRRNNGRKDGEDYRERQKIAMKNGTEGRFISRGKHCDDLLYCRGNACGWHRGGRKGLSDNAKYKVRQIFFLALHPYPLFLCVDGSRAVLTAMPDSACRLRLFSCPATTAEVPSWSFINVRPMMVIRIVCMVLYRDSSSRDKVDFSV